MYSLYGVCSTYGKDCNQSISRLTANKAHTVFTAYTVNTVFAVHTAKALTRSYQVLP